MLTHPRLALVLCTDSPAYYPGELFEPPSPRTAVNRAALPLEMPSSRTHNNGEEQREPAGTGGLFMFIRNLPPASGLLTLSI